MKIDYYELGPYGNGVIYRHFIDTDHANYVRHDDTEVTIRKNQCDVDGGEYDDRFDEVGYCRIYSTIQSDVIAALESRRDEIDSAITNIRVRGKAVNE